MRAQRLYLPILIASLFACKNKQESDSTLRVPGFEEVMAHYGTNNDSAFILLNQIATQPTDSLTKATAYSFMGIIQTQEGDYFGGQESMTVALSLLNERKADDHYCLTSTYNELGNNSINLKNYNSAIEYYDKAIHFATGTDTKLTALNGKALAYQKLSQYGLAVKIYNAIIDSTKRNSEDYARAITNRAKTRWLQNPAYPALHEFLRALKIRDSLNDQRGLNSSYAHLSDYYARLRTDSALYFANKMFSVALKINNPDDEQEALVKLIKLGKTEDLRQYAIRNQDITDSLQIARGGARNQFALIRYGVEKSKIDNLQLQKDNAQKDIQLLSVIALTVFIAVIGYAYYRKRIKDNQLKTSQKVHDIVANGIYRTMTAIEHSAFDKEQLLDDLEKLYDQSRDISYDVPTTQQTPFQQVISSLAASYRSSTTSVYVTGNNQSLWDQLPQRSRTQIHMVLQELLVNMKKHSGAENVVIKFEQQNNTINIYYKDDGIGLPDEVKFGNGLTNTGTRIKSIGGEFIFEPATKGLNIRISIPTDRQS